MKILITGASGFLGKKIAEVLEKEHDIISLSRSSGDYQISLENNIPYFNEKFDLIIHAAGKAHFFPKTDLDSNSFFNINVNGTYNLLRGLEKIKLPRYFVFISSVSVYGKEEGELINEETPLNPTEPYGRSKMLAERLIIDWCQNNNISFTILRPTLIVGENPPGNLAAMVNSIKKGYYFNISK
jgi:nucleoside-diphosphate-sugar epimerase